MLLTDRVVIVSGIGPGMGRDISLACAREGADIVLAARTEARLAEVAAEVEGLGRTALAVVTDITDQAQCDHLVQAAQERFGRIDVLVNNAFRQPPFETIEAMSIDTWNDSLDINVTGALRLTKAVIPTMKAQHRGSIVMINTMSVRTARPNFGAYAAAKGALFSLARTLANELGPDGIRVNSVAPGYIYGDSVEWYFRQQAEKRGITFEQVYDEIARETALRFIPHSSDIADTVVFFASDLARAVTGQTLDVNGGHYLHF
jgi:NAD(P)-dependent dehydrogenase (short-subunit alcohol dehydrogenase family)